MERHINIINYCIVNKKFYELDNYIYLNKIEISKFIFSIFYYFLYTSLELVIILKKNGLLTKKDLDLIFNRNSYDIICMNIELQTNNNLICMTEKYKICNYLIKSGDIIIETKFGVNLGLQNIFVRNVTMSKI